MMLLKVVANTVSVGEGQPGANIGLSDKEFASLRYLHHKAYTNWMRNYGDDGFFLLRHLHQQCRRAASW